MKLARLTRGDTRRQPTTECVRGQLFDDRREQSAHTSSASTLRNNSGQVLARSGTLTRPSMKKVLVVDDSETVRRHVADALKEHFIVLEASDGRQALDCLRRESGLSLLILDVNMPLMNGLDLLECSNSESGVNVPPTLMLTTEADPALIERARNAGARGWMIKPVNQQKLVSACKKLTE
jgi:two-component system chemotaxis response regulator CheY